MKVLIIGKEGMLGDDLAEKYGNCYETTLIGEETVDLRRYESIKAAILSEKPDVVINCAAMTNVDQCEREPEPAFEINAEGAGLVARVCGEQGCKLVHISTDYVFEGRPDEPYIEDEKPSPVCVYSESKLEGERKVRAEHPDHLIIRAAWIFGFKDKSFVQFILRLSETREAVRVVDDQIGSPTYTMDIGEGISRLLAKDCRGTYHLTNGGYCTRYEFAREIFRIAGFDPARLQPISFMELNWLARRPDSLMLSMKKLQRDTGYIPRHWKAALKEYLQKEGYAEKTITGDNALPGLQG